MVVFQRTVKQKVVARPQAGECPIEKSVSPYKQNPAGEREHTKDSPVKKKVDTILCGPCKVEKSHRACDKYAQEARYLPRAAVHSTSVCPSGDITSKLEDIVFSEAYVNWVHHPHEDALVIMAKIANNLVHRILVDNRSAINIL